MKRTQHSPLRLPFREWRRLRRKSLAAQQLDQSEVCGLLCLNRIGCLVLHFLENTASKPGGWQLSESTIRGAADNAQWIGLRVLGTFHSHPISWAIPGPSDRRSITMRSWQLIYDVCGTDAKLWRRDRRGRLRQAPLEIERRPDPTLHRPPRRR